MERIFCFLFLGVLVFCGLGCDKENLPKADQEGAFDKRYCREGMVSEGVDVIRTADGGYLLLGTTAKIGDEDNRDLYLVKTDEKGDSVWDSVYVQQYDVEAVRVIALRDGSGYVVLGNRFDMDNEYDKVFLMGVSLTGGEKWMTPLFDDELDSYEEAADVKEVADSLVVVGETTNDVRFAGGTSVFLVKLTMDGDEVDDYINDFEEDEVAAGMEWLEDVDDYLAVCSKRNDVSGKHYFQVLKHRNDLPRIAYYDEINAYPDLVIDFPEGVIARNSCLTDGGGLVILGETEVANSEVVFFRVDGSFRQEVAAVALPLGAYQKPVGLDGANDGGFVLTSTVGLDVSEVLLAKVTGAGVLEWEVRFGLTEFVNSAGTVVSLVDGGYAFTGTFNRKMGLVRVNSVGELVPEDL